MTIEDIVAASGTGERSLFYGFKRWCGTTPKAYLREVRLAMARHALESGRPGDASVAQTAMNAGFRRFCQCSRLYLQPYGQSPYATRRLLGNRRCRNTVIRRTSD